jgi:hypothetical protein
MIPNTGTPLYAQYLHVTCSNLVWGKVEYPDNQKCIIEAGYHNPFSYWLWPGEMMG